MDTMTSDSADSISSRQHVYEVTELNKNIKNILEETYPFIWILGEISNFRVPSSGHCYFTLKDPRSQISAVMFRTQANSLKFRPADGLSVIGLGRISVYEPRGSYQVIFEYLEPKGLGGLQIAFEKLKKQLSEEGLFDARYKLPLPAMPKKISIITSPTGAAVRDFINVAHRRFPNLAIEIVPVSVQGDRSPGEIVQAIRLLNKIGTTDVIVLARGGGSIEDLCAFNDEQVARTLFASGIPVISAVGHETDFTIADFVADLRAPTPSAAAEIAVPSKIEIQNQLSKINRTLHQTIISYLKILEKTADSLNNRIIHPRRRLQDMRIRLDDYSIRLFSVINKSLRQRSERIGYGRKMLMQVSPVNMLTSMKAHITFLQHTLVAQMNQFIRDGYHAITRNGTVLDALNPMGILQRGYSITRTLPGGSIVRNARKVAIDQKLEILLGRGVLTVTVTGRKTDTE